VKGREERREGEGRDKKKEMGGERGREGKAFPLLILQFDHCTHESYSEWISVIQQCFALVCNSFALTVR